MQLQGINKKTWILPISLYSVPSIMSLAWFCVVFMRLAIEVFSTQSQDQGYFIGFPRQAKSSNQSRATALNVGKKDAEAMKQLMAPLPAFRLKSSPVWHYSMLDLFGPRFCQPTNHQKDLGSHHYLFNHQSLPSISSRVRLYWPLTVRSGQARSQEWISCGIFRRSRSSNSWCRQCPHRSYGKHRCQASPGFHCC